MGWCRGQHDGARLRRRRECAESSLLSSLRDKGSGGEELRRDGTLARSYQLPRPLYR